MKKQVIRAFVLLSLLPSLSATYVYAQKNTLIRKVEIPFNFSVGDKTLPAGIYHVTRIFQDKSAVQLTNEDGREVATILTKTVRAKEMPETGKLIFRRYGEKYFLFQIWESDDIQGRELSKSRTERVLERDLAKGGEKHSIVDIAPAP